MMAGAGTMAWGAFNPLGVAGLIEVIVGVLIVFGLWTRLVALVGVIEMLVAWFAVHAAKGVWNPLQNGGEAAVLYFAAFLVLFSYGAGKWSLDKGMKKA